VSGRGTKKARSSAKGAGGFAKRAGAHAKKAEARDRRYGSLEGPLFAIGLDRLVLQGDRETGLALVDPGEVSMIRVEHGGRLEISSRAGLLFHLSRPLEYVERELCGRRPGFVRVNPEALVNREHVLTVRPVAAKRWEIGLPGGYTVVMEPEDVLGTDG
jgi:hypothetical protein